MLVYVYLQLHCAILIEAFFSEWLTITPALATLVLPGLEEQGNYA
jgi:hypothetical protein